MTLPRMIRSVARLTGIVGLAASLAACTDSLAPVHLTDLVGDWKLVHLIRTSASTSETVDAMQADTTTQFTMTVASDGAIVSQSRTGTNPTVAGTGNITVSGNSTKMVLDGQAYYGKIFIERGQL